MKTGSICLDATLTIEGDIGDPDTAARVVDAAMERFGRIADQPLAALPAALAALTKGGLAAATRSRAIEYATRGIRVNAVAPGVVNTSLLPPEMRGM